MSKTGLYFANGLSKSKQYLKRKLFSEPGASHIVIVVGDYKLYIYRIYRFFLPIFHDKPVKDQFLK